MSDTTGRINFFQACLILFLMNGLTNHVIVNPMLLDASGRDAWLTVLLSGALFFVWSIPLTWMIRKTKQQKLLLWLSASSHPVIGWLLVIPLCLQLYMIGGMTTIHTATWTVANYLPTSPKLLVVLTLTLLCLLTAYWGLRTIAIAAALLLPIVVCLGYFVSFSNMKQKDFTLLTPVMEHGLPPIIHGMTYACGGFIEAVVLLAMQHKITTTIKLWKILLYAGLSMYVMLGPVIGAITEFGPIEAALQMESPYEQWRLVKLGEYIEHVDFFSIFQWLSGACVRISLAVFLCVELLPIRRKGARLAAVSFICATYIAAGLVPINEYAFYLWMYNYYFPISLGLMLSVFAAWLLVAIFGKNNVEVEA
ncbi:endospore germination permease [Paenibacillus whitsoniae]|nr:endospore germination permease [Paenibacillus whitsoniae]